MSTRSIHEDGLHIVLESIRAWKTKSTDMEQWYPYITEFQKQSFEEKNSVSSYILRGLHGYFVLEKLTHQTSNRSNRFCA